MNISYGNRRRFLQSVGGFLVVMSRQRAVKAGTVDPSALARKFLVSLFDDALKLLPEYRGSKVYWLYHDNYLASKVLAQTEPVMSKAIHEAIRNFGVSRSGKIEILFDEAEHPLPFRHYHLSEVKQIGEKIIKTEVVGGQIHEDWERYADLLFLGAIAERTNDRDKALAHFASGLKGWDGTGIRDQVNASGGLYATYKLALALIAADRLGVKFTQQDAMRRRLLSMQRNDGGFVTDYNGDGKPVGEANVETTSLAILAIKDKAAGSR